MGCLEAPEPWGPWARAQRAHWIRRPWSHVGNNKNHFVMTIVMWIPVHPYKATHFENRKSNLHFIAFMVLHKDSHHNCYRLTKFVSKHYWPNDRFSSANKQYDCSHHYFVRSYCFRKIRPDSTGVMWLKMERLWYVKKSEVWRDDDNNNKYCITVRNQTCAY